MLEAYLRTLWAFVQASRHGMVVNLPGEEDTWCSLRLSLNGAWEVLNTPPEMQAASTTTSLTIPLVMPLVPIILVAHVETQWSRNLREAGATPVHSQ